MKKYILLLVTALSFAQASNQMVSFTQAQSLGFTLKSGQSHTTSNQCMTKSEALAKYNLDASAMSSYASNQLVPRSAWFNNTSGTLRILYKLSLGDLQWSNVAGTTVTQTGNPALDGVTNCNAIIAQAGHTSSAASACLNLSAGGYSDWYLGGWGENLNLYSQRLTLNIALTAYSGNTIPSSGGIASSTQGSLDDEYIYKRLTDGANVDYKKYFYSTVRAIRKEVVADTSIYSIGDFAFGGIVFEK